MDPTLKSRIAAELKSRISTLSPQLRRVAKYIIDHPADFGMDSIRDTARKADVSTYTLVNMAKKMGFARFDDFRQPFRHALLNGAHPGRDPLHLDRLRDTGPRGAVFADASQNALSIVQTSLDRQSFARMSEVAALLVGARNVYLTAVRSSYALAYYLHYVGRMALPSLQLVPRHRNGPIDDLNDAGAGDVLIAITISPYSRETIEACRFAQGKGLKLVLITDSEVVSPDLNPTHTLVASVSSTHEFGCFSGMMAVIEVLIALLTDHGGDAAARRIESYAQLRDEIDAYWVSGAKKH